MFLSKIIFLSLFFGLSFAYSPRNDRPSSTDSYVNYLKTKEQIIMKNINNAEIANYIPQQVIWDDIQGIITAPRPNPFKRVFEPSNPKANHSGMIFYPNVDRDEEILELRLIRRKLASVLSLKITGKR